MTDTESEKEVNEQLRLKWIMIQNCKDDPVVEANMIASMEELYQKYSVKIPAEIMQFLKEEKERLKDILEKCLKQKKAELNQIIKNRDSRTMEQTEEQRRRGEEERLSKMTRTQQIFGDDGF